MMRKLCTTSTVHPLLSKPTCPAFVLVAVSVFLIVTVVDSFSFNMMASSSSSSSASTPKISCRFITNKMCPFAPKVWIALEAIDASYTLEEVSLYGVGGKPDWFWKLNPKGEVPVLVIEGDNNNVLVDSDLILDEIGEVVAPGGVVIGSNKRRKHPCLTIPSNANPNDAAKMKAFRHTLKEFLPIGKRAVLGGSDKENMMMWSKLQELNGLIEGPYVVGDDLTVADCAGFPFLWRIEQEFGHGCWKHHCCTQIEQWLIECKQIPAFQKSIQGRSWWWWW